MAKDDKLIAEFFREMKAEDNNLTIPVAPTRTQPRRVWLPYAAAATVVVVILAYLFTTHPASKRVPQIEITLSGSPASTTESLMPVSRGMDAWESPTQSLINDF